MRIIKDKDVRVMQRQMAEQGLSHAQIAKEWGIPADRVKGLIPGGKKEAKEAVAKEDTGEKRPSKAKAPPKPKEAGDK